MAKKKVVPQNPKENESLPMIQPITEILEKNYMPYAMSVIISRALPEIDGFKPSHRKLLYTMYNLGLMSGAKMKSAKIVGATMSLNPHGDSSIYETMVRLTRGHEALLHPFIDSRETLASIIRGIWRMLLLVIRKLNLSHSAKKYFQELIKMR